VAVERSRALEQFGGRPERASAAAGQRGVIDCIGRLRVLRAKLPLARR
jgi:hypothetical protein